MLTALRRACAAATTGSCSAQFAGIRDLYTHYEHTDLAQHPAIITVPYQVRLLKRRVWGLFAECYNIPHLALAVLMPNCIYMCPCVCLSGLGLFGRCRYLLVEYYAWVPMFALAALLAHWHRERARALA